MKTKADLVIDIMREARSDRVSNSAAKRTVKTLRGLGLQPDEVIHDELSGLLPSGWFSVQNENIVRCW